MSQQWYYNRNGQRFGPVSAIELKQLATSGQLSPTDMVWKEGIPNWVKAERVKGLFVARDASAPTPPARSCHHCGKGVPHIAQFCPACGVSLTISPALAHERAGSAQTATTIGAPPTIEGSPSDLVRGEKGTEAPPTAGSVAYVPPPELRTPPGPDSSPIAGLHRQRIVIAAAAGVGMFATFLPWVHIPIIGSISGTAGDGWVTLALFIPAVILALRGAKTDPLLGNARLGAALPAAVAAVIGLTEIADLSRIGDNAFAKAIGATARIGIGLYVLIAAGAALVLFAWALASSSDERDPTND